MATDETAKRVIAELKHVYCWSYDRGDLDTLVHLFTDDAVCDFGELGRWEGRTEIRRAYAAQMAASQVPGTWVHSVTNPRIEVDGDTARGRWYLVDLHTTPDERRPARIHGWYDDLYRRDQSGWRIARTSIEFLWQDTAPPEDDPTRALLDRAEIEQVATRCARALDSRDWASLGTCFTDDCVVEYAASGRFNGPDDVVQACRTALDELDVSQHFLTNMEVTLSGDEADSRSYVAAQHVRGGRTFMVGGTYKTPGRALLPDGASPAAASPAPGPPETPPCSLRPDRRKGPPECR